jgi:hypothetical protein
MKKANLFALVISSFLIFSCGGDGDDAGPGGSGGNSLSATVTGDITANFNASGEVQGQKLVQATIASSGVLSIVANDGTGSSITFGITGYDGAGTYSLDPTSSNTAAFISVDTETFQTTGVTATSGSVEITLNGDVINGTFDYDGEGSNDITASVTGEFSVTADEQ